MWYMPYLRVRTAVFVYVYIGLGIFLVALALRFWPGAVHLGAHERLAQVSLDEIVSAGTAFGGGFATVLGLNLAAENDGHLELAWTKPISREGYALGVFAVDIVAMIACIVFTALCSIVGIDIAFAHQAVGLGSPQSLLDMLAFCGFPLCVYAWIVALSASFKRNRGVVVGIFWPLMFVLALLPHVTHPPFKYVASLLDYLNPLSLFSLSSSSEPPLALYAWGWAVAALLLGAALVQWRRLEL
jgi:hypothetical protein